LKTKSDPEWDHISKGTQYTYIGKINHLILLKVTAVYFKNLTDHINIGVGKNTKF